MTDDDSKVVTTLVERCDELSNAARVIEQRGNRDAAREIGIAVAHLHRARQMLTSVRPLPGIGDKL